MNSLKEISRVFENAEEILFDNSSKFVLMSDCHRGDGNWGDNFAKNQNICFNALNYYYDKGYTYIELGDGDELWENRKLDEIKEIHSNMFWLLSKFHNKKRLYFIYGNHDMVKKDDKYVKHNMYNRYDSKNKMDVPMFPDIKIHEGLILRYKPTKDRMLLLHGHQADFFNSKLWKLSRTLVRYLWRPLEIFGVNDPVRTAKNYKKRDLIEKHLAKWSEDKRHMLIAGHTHRPMFPEPGSSAYFNDGSCVHPRCATAIEISDGAISLVKWEIKTRDDGVLVVGRESLEGPVKLMDYFERMRKENN